jgi:hypothetical protein
MIARHETHLDKTDIWSALSAPLPPGVISWRQDGRPISRDGRHIARFVAYIEANTVRERLDAVVPGEWDLTLELLPPVTGLEDDANQGPCSFKARLQILGVIREDVGTGKDYKQASTDAFKRAAVRFGIGHELYQLGTNWVELESGAKGARPVEDPQAAHDRRVAAQTGAASPQLSLPTGPTLSLERGAAELPDVPACPLCNGRMWDNRLNKRNPKAPDFKCRDRRCDGVVWRLPERAV